MQPIEATPVTTRQLSELLMLLPFELVLKYLEATALREFEAARKITLQSAKEFNIVLKMACLNLQNTYNT